LLNTLLGTLSSGVAAATGSYESIASATGTGSSGTITFSSIPSTYIALQIRYNARTSAADVDDFVSFRFNSDSGSNYAWHFLEGTGSSTSATGSANSDIAYSGQTTASNASAYMMGVGIFEIIDYASTTKAKTVRSFGGNDRNGAGNLRLTSDLWTSTSAINRIDITNFRGGNWTSDTTFALYGIKGA
jgi:hypothetical protein